MLPDDANTLKLYGRTLGVSAADPIGLLSEIGADCPGAIIFGEPHLDGGLEPIPDGDMEALIAGLRTHNARSVFGQEPGYFSLAGAQAKTALVLRNGTWFRPQGSKPSTHILKPRMQDWQDQDLNEHFCLRLARYAGIPSAESQVVRYGNESAIVTARYDRIVEDSFGTLRIHQEDMCQALGLHPVSKYEYEGGSTCQDIFTILRLYSTEKKDIETFFKALIFNYLICGLDAHAKNYSILHAGDNQVALAPLYDVNSLFPDAKRRSERKLAMSIGGKRVLYDVRPFSFVREAATAGIDPDAARAWVEQMALCLPAHARDCRAELNRKSDTLDVIVSAIEAQAALILKRF